MLLDRRRIKVVDRDEQPDVLIEVLQRDRKADGGSVATAAPLLGAECGGGINARCAT
jgi:hypothetical protein